MGAPAVADGVVYVGSSDHYVYTMATAETGYPEVLIYSWGTNHTDHEFAESVTIFRK